MFNEATLHKYPALIGAFTGIPAKEFWDMLDKMVTVSAILIIGMPSMVHSANCA